jgi:hypothetical protein
VVDEVPLAYRAVGGGLGVGITIVRFGLLPRDALHMAIMQRLGLSEIATDDADFDRVFWLRRHWVFNAPVPWQTGTGCKREIVFRHSLSDCWREVENLLNVRLNR